MIKFDKFTVCIFALGMIYSIKNYNFFCSYFLPYKVLVLFELKFMEIKSQISGTHIAILLNNALIGIIQLRTIMEELIDDN